MISIIIVDDHELFRFGLRSALIQKAPDINIVAEAESGEELFALLPDLKVDVILLDIIFTGFEMSGIEIAQQLKNNYPAVKILVLSSENSEETIHQMIEIGIDGFISKRQTVSEKLPEAIRLIAAGENFYGRDISTVLYSFFVSHKNTSEPTVEFTNQEREILLLCKEGLSGKLIADRLNISPRTVDNHKNNIFHKLGVHSTIEMVQYAFKKGIITVNG